MGLQRVRHDWATFIFMTGNKHGSGINNLEVYVWLVDKQKYFWKTISICEEDKHASNLRCDVEYIFAYVLYIFKFQYWRYYLK